MGFFDVVRTVAEGLIELGNAEQERITREYDSRYLQAERKVNSYATLHKNADAIKKVEQARKKLNESYNMSNIYRRTDAELENDKTGLDKKTTDFQIVKNVSLKDGTEIAESITGVYILYLNGQVMKCGRAAYGSGVRWRLKQYYNLNYDDRARKGDYWSISPQNKEKVKVSWQCCPVSKCKELEYKLFEKYGKGPWGKRAPINCTDDTWQLLI